MCKQLLRAESNKRLNTLTEGMVTIDVGSLFS